MRIISILDYAKDILGFVLVGGIIFGISIVSNGTLFVQV